MDYSRKIIPPSYDVVFKAIFGREENKPLIISLLSSILTIKVQDLDDLVIMNNEIFLSNVDGKGSRLDLRLKLKDKTEIDVEIQAYNHAAFSDHMEIHMIELPKIEAYNKDIDNPLLVRWMEFLNVRSEHDMADLKTKDDLPEEILIALEELDKLSQDPSMRMEALNKEMWIRDQISLIRMAENAEKNGYDSGFEKGYNNGYEKGSVVSREEESKAIAKKLKDLGVDVDIIQSSTGLDPETIKNL